MEDSNKGVCKIVWTDDSNVAQIFLDQKCVVMINKATGTDLYNAVITYFAECVTSDHKLQDKIIEGLKYAGTVIKDCILPSLEDVSTWILETLKACSLTVRIVNVVLWAFKYVYDNITVPLLSETTTGIRFSINLARIAAHTVGGLAGMWADFGEMIQGHEDAFDFEVQEE